MSNVYGYGLLASRLFAIGCMTHFVHNLFWFFEEARELGYRTC